MNPETLKAKDEADQAEPLEVVRTSCGGTKIGPELG